MIRHLHAAISLLAAALLAACATTSSQIADNAPAGWIVETGSTGTAWTGNCTSVRDRQVNSKHAGELINFALGDGTVRSVNTAAMGLTPWAILNGVAEGFVTPAEF